jgi:uncharacterized protein with von Willebrand factor type A (vWA) domain
MQPGERLRYGRWDGSQEPFDSGPDALLDALADDALEPGGLARALRNLYRRGLPGERDGLRGLSELRKQLAQRRQQLLERHRMESVTGDLRARLAEVLRLERAGIERRLRDAAQPGADPALAGLLRQRAARAEASLNALGPGLGGAVRRLQEHAFIDPDARNRFGALLDELRRGMLGTVSERLREQVAGLTPQDMDASRALLEDLNRLLREREDGQEPDFQGFMARWGQAFGDPPPRDLDELLERIAERFAQMRSLLASMSPEERAELFAALEAALDPATAAQMAELAEHLARLMPGAMQGAAFPFQGEGELGLSEAMEVMGQLAGMEALDTQLVEAMRSGDVSGVDAEALSAELGEEAADALARLGEVERQLEEAGFLKRDGERVRLTPAAVRRIRQGALRELFSGLRPGRAGEHETARRGAGGELTEQTRAWEFGEPLELHLPRTVMNAVQRAGTGTPVRLEVEDFALREREHASRAATVLLIDQSRSMGLFGSFTAAKKVALALEALVRSRFPRDRLFIGGFSDYAQAIRPDDLAELEWNAWRSGTNLQHALQMARRWLAPHGDCTKQVFLITDGEPTAHLESGRALFSYPPTLRTVRETLREVHRATAAGITINTFMLESSPYLQDFVERMSRINHGRALYTDPDRLGRYVLVDFLRGHRRRVGEEAPGP